MNERFKMHEVSPGTMVAIGLLASATVALFGHSTAHADELSVPGANPGTKEDRRKSAQRGVQYAIIGVTPHQLPQQIALDTSHS